MSSRTIGQEKLFKKVESFAREVDDELVERCRAICRPYDHPLIGPVLQYKVDDYNLGRHLVFCKDTHPGNPDNPGRVWMPVSASLTIAERGEIREFRREQGLRADGTRLANKPRQQTNKPNKKKAKSRKASAGGGVIDLTLDATPPSDASSRAPPARAPLARSPSVEIIRRAPLARSPSVEIIRVVPAPTPVLHDRLDVWYFVDNEKAPVSFTFKARPARREFRFRQYVDTLLCVEIKQTDPVMVLTTANGGDRTWSTFRVFDLMIPRTQSKLVIARPRVTKPHADILAFADHAYPGAATLEGRILPLPT
ncbi:unnamed protein product [Peniophora sp. CBMAI 1063]|nr:unnamed protein product [Peniophora sp. CBMAI 1063]